MFNAQRYQGRRFDWRENIETMVLVLWSTCLPSSPSIRVQIPLNSTLILLEKNVKEAGNGQWRHTWSSPVLILMWDILDGLRCWFEGRLLCDGRPPKIEKVLPRPDLLPEKALWSLDNMDSFLGMEDRCFLLIEPFKVDLCKERKKEIFENDEKRNRKDSFKWSIIGHS